MEGTQIPSIFLPVVTTRSGETRYKDLSKAALLPPEKQFLCEEIDGVSNLLAPTRIIHDRKDHHQVKYQREIARRYLLKERCVSKWMKKFRSGEVFHDHGGRPHSLDDAGYEAIKVAVVEGTKSKKPVLQNELYTLVRSQVIATMKRRGLHVENEDAVTVHESVVLQVVHRLGIRFLKPQTLAEALLKTLVDANRQNPDDRVLCKQDVILVTHEHFLEAYQNRKIPPLSPLLPPSLLPLPLLLLPPTEPLFALDSEVSVYKEVPSVGLGTTETKRKYDAYLRDVRREEEAARKKTTEANRLAAMTVEEPTEERDKIKKIAAAKKEQKKTERAELNQWGREMQAKKAELQL
jgi:transposase